MFYKQLDCLNNLVQFFNIKISATSGSQQHAQEISNINCEFLSVFCTGATHGIHSITGLGITKANNNKIIIVFNNTKTAQEIIVRVVLKSNNKIKLVGDCLLQK